MTAGIANLLCAVNAGINELGIADCCSVNLNAG
jgi:hypothetical protein